MAYKPKKKAWIIRTKEGKDEIFFFSRFITEKQSEKIYEESE
mgnify:FL=1